MSLDCYYCGRPAVTGTDLCRTCLDAYPSVEAANIETATKRLIASILKGNARDVRP